MAFDSQIAHSVEEVGQETWDRLASDQPFASYRWYRFSEVVRADDTPIYIILSHRQEPVARATFWLQREEPMPIPSPILRRVTRAILARWPLLLCRSPIASMSGLTLPKDPPLRNTALEMIVQIAQDQAGRHNASFVAFDYLTKHETQWPIWTDGFAPTMIPEPGTFLEITWPDFDNYVELLPRKKRKHYRQHLRYGAKMGVEITAHPTVTDVDGAMKLIHNVAERYRETLAAWERRKLENADMVDAVWLAARIGERLVGCELMLGDRGTWLITSLGRDYDYDYVYFLLGYADIRYAIESQARTLRWGACSYDVKQRLGFQLEGNNHVVFAGRGPVLSQLGRWVAHLA